MILRVCLMDKSSILIERDSLTDFKIELNNNKFIKSREGELINTDYIWCVRKSSKTIDYVKDKF